MARTWAVIAGGGTGGHILPALAIGHALVARGHDADTIHFVGSRRGLEVTLVRDAGFGITLLPGRGIARRLTVASIVANAGALAGLAVAVAQALVLVARRRPAIVLSLGGYASAPVAMAAVVLRVPLVVVEQNAVAGAANALAARFARASAVAFEGTRLPRSVVTGNPVSDEVAAVDRSVVGRRSARRHLNLPAERTVVAAFGGSLGSRRINEAVVGLAGRWADRTDVAIRHVLGRRDWPSLSASLPVPPRGGLDYQAVEYEDCMPMLYAAADVAVCRAGATTVAELAASRMPGLLVPLPGAPGDHQTANARHLAEAGAAVLVPDAELTTGRLEAELEALFTQPGRLEAMAAAAQRQARPAAAEAVADVVERHARA